MKLRNKKTGEIISSKELLTDECIIDLFSKIFNNFNSKLNKILEEWEVVPQEPVIKDDKVRKAVRAWAEVNRISSCICKVEMHCITFETERDMFISFENADTIPPEGNFTITELCGE